MDRKAVCLPPRPVAVAVAVQKLQALLFPPTLVWSPIILATSPPYHLNSPEYRTFPTHTLPIPVYWTSQTGNRREVR